MLSLLFFMIYLQAGVHKFLIFNFNSFFLLSYPGGLSRWLRSCVLLQGQEVKVELQNKWDFEEEDGKMMVDSHEDGQGQLCVTSESAACKK